MTKAFLAIGFTLAAPVVVALIGVSLKANPSDILALSFFALLIAAMFAGIAWMISEI